MKNENKQMLLDLNRVLISNAMTEISEQLETLTIYTTNEEAKVVFDQCDKSLSVLHNRLSQLKSNFGIQIPM